MTQPVETAPARPPAPRRQSPWQRINAFLVSPKLAIALLVAVLICCVVGVTVWRGSRAGELIFATLWFNAMLVLLAISSFAAFFSRIWKRRLTLVSAGMILFHLSFVAVLGGVVYNSLFRFQGILRLTEGETLPNTALSSYDAMEHGRFFDFRRIRGETTLVKMHRDYLVDGKNKRAAYEILVGEGAAKERAVIYVTEYQDFDGVRFFCSKEGYSVLLALKDRDGRESQGLFVPLQSIRQPDGSRLYATGSAAEPGPFFFPQPPARPAALVQMIFWPSDEDRQGQVAFKVAPLDAFGSPGAERKGLVAVGDAFDAGDFSLVVKEIRYWVGMDVRYDPGLTFIMASLVFGLLGMVLTLTGRLRQGPRRKAA